MLRTIDHGCFQYDKDTKKKANHNLLLEAYDNGEAVSNTTKILKRKQITTVSNHIPIFLLLLKWEQKGMKKSLRM